MADDLDRWMAKAGKTPEISDVRIARVIERVMARVDEDATPGMPMFARPPVITRLGLSLATAVMLGVLAAPIMLGTPPPHGCLAALVNTVYDTSEVY